MEQQTISLPFSQEGMGIESPCYETHEKIDVAYTLPFPDQKGGLDDLPTVV